MSLRYRAEPAKDLLEKGQEVALLAVGISYLTPTAVCVARTRQPLSHVLPAPVKGLVRPENIV